MWELPALLSEARSFHLMMTESPGVRRDMVYLAMMPDDLRKAYDNYGRSLTYLDIVRVHFATHISRESNGLHVAGFLAPGEGVPDRDVMRFYAIEKPDTLRECTFLLVNMNSPEGGDVSHFSLFTRIASLLALAEANAYEVAKGGHLGSTLTTRVREFYASSWEHLMGEHVFLNRSQMRVEVDRTEFDLWREGVIRRVKESLDEARFLARQGIMSLSRTSVRPGKPIRVEFQRKHVI